MLRAHANRILTIATLALVVASPLRAQDHGDGHEASSSHALLEQFEANKAGLHALVEGLSTAQWNYKSVPDRWSIAEVVEHIIIAEKSTWDVLTTQLTAKEVSDSDRQMAEGVESQIAATLRDRSQRFPAPPDFVPTGRWAGGDDVMGMFDEVRGAMIMFLRDADFDLRTRAAPNPITGGDVDAHGWAVIAVEHCARHMQQIQEVMDTAGYPSD